MPDHEKLVAIAVSDAIEDGATTGELIALLPSETLLTAIRILDRSAEADTARYAYSALNDIGSEELRAQIRADVERATTVKRVLRVELDSRAFSDFPPGHREGE